MKKILLVNANYYKVISEKLVLSSKKRLKNNKVKINIINGFIALGCVIKGQTPHFDLICSSTFYSILNISTTFNKPIGNGIITAYTMRQALQRCKSTTSKKPNKGTEAANAVMSILQNGPKKI